MNKLIAELRDWEGGHCIDDCSTKCPTFDEFNKILAKYDKPEKSGLEQMVDWLENDLSTVIRTPEGTICYKTMLDKAYTLLEQEQKPTSEPNPRHECVQGGIDEMYSSEPTEQGLREALQGWVSGFRHTIEYHKSDPDGMYCFVTADDIIEFDKILSRHQTEPPLADKGDAK